MKVQTKQNIKSMKDHFVKWISNLSSYTKNKTINMLWFLLAFFIIGGTNYYLMFHIFVPTFFILDFFFTIFLVSPILFFKKNKFDAIYLPIIIFFFTLFYVINSMFFDYFGTVFSLKDIGWAIQNIMQVGYNAASIKWWIAILNICLCAFFITLLILFDVKWKFKPNKADLQIKKRKKLIVSFSALFGSLILYESSLQIWCACERKNDKDDIDYVNFSPNYHFEKLGLAGYYTQELRELIFDKGSSVNEIKSYMKNGHFLNDDYSGLLENSNVIVILVETGDQTMVNEKTTPNLYSLLTNGVYCNKNYSSNHTDQADILTINGSHPNFHMNVKSNFTAPFNLPNALKNKPDHQYQTFFTTDLAPVNDEYNTMQFIKKFGYQNHLFHYDLIPDVEPWSYKYSTFTRDSIFMEALKERIKTIPQDSPFYMQYLTIHMHMNHVLNSKNKKMYEDLEKEFGATLDLAEQEGKWKNPFNKNSEDGKRFRRWTLNTMDFDKGLGLLMDCLYKSGSSYLENTLLVPFGDHNWFEVCQNGHSFAQNIKHTYDRQCIKQYSTVLGFYHPKLNQKFAETHTDHKLNLPTAPTVVVPTIMDLLGETQSRHNPKIYISKSIFDPTFDDNEVFYQFAGDLYMNEKFTSINGYDITHSNSNDKVAREKFLENMKIVRKHRRIFDTIIKYNIFGRYNYTDFMPKEISITSNIIYNKEYY